MAPFGPDAKGFFGPGAEGDGFNHCWRHDLFTSEATPGDRVQTFLVGCLEVALTIASKVCHLVVFVKLLA